MNQAGSAVLLMDETGWQPVLLSAHKQAGSAVLLSAQKTDRLPYIN